MRSASDRAAAENFFVRDGKTLAQVAEIVGVSEAALAKWSKAGDWVKKRAERQRESPQAALDLLKRQREIQIQAIGGEKQADAGAIDALHKLNQVIEKMEAGVAAIGPTLDVVGRLAEYVMRSTDDPTHITIMREWIEKFLAEERRRNT